MGKKGRAKRYFSKEYKLSVVKRNIDGESSGKLSKELGLDKSLVCHWEDHGYWEFEWYSYTAKLI